MNRGLAEHPAGGALKALVLAGFVCLLLWLSIASECLAQNLPESANDGSGLRAANFPPEVLDPQTPEADFDLFLVPLREEDLSQLARHFQDALKAHLVEMSRMTVASRSGADMEREEAQASWEEHRTALRLTTRKFNSLLRAWSVKGGDREAIAKYRLYLVAALTEGARQLDLVTATSSIARWVKDPDGGIALAVRLGVLAGGIASLIALAAVIRRLAKRRLARTKTFSQLLKNFVGNFFYWVVIIVGLAAILRALGVDITPLFALFGGLSFIIGFAFQETLGNLASGLLIMIYRPFDEGDEVKISDVSGSVKSVSAVGTTIVTADNRVIVIPNKQVWASAITNVNSSAIRRLDLSFGVAFATDIGQAIKVLGDAVKSHPDVLADPPPTHLVGDFTDSSVTILCRPWVRSVDYWRVRSELLKDIVARFADAGIVPSYPQLGVHIRQDVASGG